MITDSVEGFFFFKFWDINYCILSLVGYKFRVLLLLLQSWNVISMKYFGHPNSSKLHSFWGGGGMGGRWSSIFSVFKQYIVGSTFKPFQPIIWLVSSTFISHSVTKSMGRKVEANKVGILLEFLNGRPNFVCVTILKWVSVGHERVQISWQGLL